MLYSIELKSVMQEMILEVFPPLNIWHDDQLSDPLHSNKNKSNQPIRFIPLRDEQLEYKSNYSPLFMAMCNLSNYLFQVRYNRGEGE